MNQFKLRCFVAMAVGRPDTDKFYEKLLKPILRAANIQSVFMGELEHNDDIDKRIIAEIEKCDLAIADLTYARPSVYFEAGYAQRKVPVIYTARKDHFSPTPDDEEGNRRVHFDLLMRNIVPWGGADEVFTRKLQRRIEIVTSPILVKLRAVEQNRQEEAQFQKLSLHSRIRTVNNIFIAAMKRVGYKPTREIGFNPWVGFAVVGTVFHLGVLVVDNNFSQTEIQQAAHDVVLLMRARFEAVGDRSDVRAFEYVWRDHHSQLTKIGTVEARLILCSLEKIPRSRVEKGLPSFTAANAGHFRGQNLIYAPADKQITAEIDVQIFDGIKSEPIANSMSAELGSIRYPRKTS